jgi:hypothetical protein
MPDCRDNSIAFVLPFGVAMRAFSSALDQIDKHLKLQRQPQLNA